MKGVVVSLVVILVIGMIIAGALNLLVEAKVGRILMMFGIVFLAFVGLVSLTDKR